MKKPIVEIKQVKEEPDTIFYKGNWVIHENGNSIFYVTGSSGDEYFNGMCVKSHNGDVFTDIANYVPKKFYKEFTGTITITR